MGYKDKLIRETESLRIYEADKKDKKEKKEFEETSGFWISVKTGKPIKSKEGIKLMGFNLAYKDNTKKEVLFAWKFKHEDRNILVYFNPNLSKKKKEETLEGFKITNFGGYNITDLVKDTLPSIRYEMDIIEKKRKNKNG